MLVQASRHVELFLASSAKTKKHQPDVAVCMEWGATAEEVSTMEKELVSYMASCRARLAGFHVFGLPTDKGCGVGGQSLQNTLVITADNYAHLSPPQAC